MDGVDAVVTDLVMDGMDSPNGNGLRIKSDASRGGQVATRHPETRGPIGAVAQTVAIDDLSGDRIPAFHSR